MREFFHWITLSLGKLEACSGCMLGSGLYAPHTCRLRKTFGYYAEGDTISLWGVKQWRRR